MLKQSAVGALILSFSSALAGPLTPPPGPITSTHKTLTEVEPRTPINATNTPGDADSVFRIALTGSYYLTASVVGEAGKSGIEIAAENVTLDLNGFEVVGVAGAIDGINSGPSPGVGGATIRNGTIRNWPGNGVHFPSILLRSLACRFENLTARDNGLIGFVLRDSSIIVGCIAEGNTRGFETGDNAALSNCSAFGSSGDGFNVGSGSTVHNCMAMSNGNDGFTGGTGPVSYVACAAASNTGDGFQVAGALISACSSGFNTGFGYRIEETSVIGSHSQSFFGSGGISAVSNCHIRDNSITSGTTGIEVTGTDCRVQGNNVTNCTTGIRVITGGNLIISNSVTGGTRYSIVAGNAVGPIVTAANVPTNTIPTANFDF